MADEKFNVPKVRNGMTIIENHFAAFQETMKSINSFIETNVNASLGSSAYKFISLGTTCSGCILNLPRVSTVTCLKSYLSGASFLQP